MEEHERLKRRRSPAYVRAMNSGQLHGLALRLMRLEQDQDLTAGQDWLWSAVVSELEYRWRRATPGHRCTCELCFDTISLELL